MIQNKIGGKIEFGPVPQGEIKNITADISKIREKLNFNPKGELSKELDNIIKGCKKL
jgi:nucleoside-diphosphate-sugar epimerase